MHDIVNSLITSGVIMALLTIAGNYINNRRKDGNDRIEEYREDLKTLKKENKDLQKENTKLLLQNISLRDELRNLKQKIA